MAMDQTEKLGLGTAIGGHVLLVVAMVLGLFFSTDRIKRAEPIAVSLVGEIAEVSTAPDPIQEEPAPPAAAQTEPAEPPPAPVMQIERPVAKPQVKPVEKPLKREVPPPAKTAAKKVPVKQSPAKVAAAAVKSGKGTAPAKTGGLSKSFEDSINNVGKAPGAGKAIGTPAAKSGAEVRRATSNTIAAEVRPLIPGCAPRTSDNSSLRIFASLNIDKSAKLVAANVYDVQGVTESNSAQVESMKRCVLESLRAASPYNLDPSEFEMWRDHKVQLKVNFN